MSHDDVVRRRIEELERDRADAENKAARWLKEAREWKELSISLQAERKELRRELRDLRTRLHEAEAREAEAGTRDACP